MNKRTDAPNAAIYIRRDIFSTDNVWTEADQLIETIEKGKWDC